MAAVPSRTDGMEDLASDIGAFDERVEGELSELEQHAELALEWPVLLAALAERTLSVPGHARLLGRRPARSREEAQSSCARVRVVLALGEHGVELPVRPFPDISHTLARLRLGASASGQELIDVRSVLELARDLRRVHEEHADAGAELAALLGSDPRLDRLAQRLSESLERDGSVADAASPALAEARARCRELASELKRRLGELVHRYSDVLSGQYYTERDGRYVLPVRSDAHYRVEGIVLGSSGSGSTLFVEPREVTDLGNRLRVREAAVERESARVLAELSALAGGKLVELAQAFEVCVEADVTHALARWAVESRSRPIEPAEEDRFDVRAARHPLLVLASTDVVANDLVLAGGKALVISGPNAGGKTVALKCLGLFAWMVRAGIPVPAGSESQIGWFDRVVADVGDEQSLVRSLSTFSAHVQNLSRIVAHAAPHVLVLLDEVAAGTDPEEGAALAAAVLEALTARGAAVAVTTHYERLKELAAHEGPLENASVGFDFEAMEPTFRLTLGVPGASSALAVAERHGLPREIVLRAREHLPRAAIERERVVHELMLERERLSAERLVIEAERERQAASARELEAEHVRLHESAEREVEREVRELVARVKSARHELEQARGTLREKQLDATSLKTAERAVSRVAAQVAIGGPLAPSARGRPSTPLRVPDPGELLPGTRVRVRATGAHGTVLERPSRGEVRLRVGALRLTQRLDQVEVVLQSSQTAARAKPRLARSSGALAEARRTSDNTIDLRGVRVEDAPARLDAFLDRMLGEGESVGFVLHGHGTGALRTRVREHLGGSQYVENVRSAEPDEGGEAFTVFWVR